MSILSSLYTAMLILLVPSSLLAIQPFFPSNIVPGKPLIVSIPTLDSTSKVYLKLNSNKAVRALYNSATNSYIGSLPVPSNFVDEVGTVFITFINTRGERDRYSFFVNNSIAPQQSIVSTSPEKNTLSFKLYIKILLIALVIYWILKICLLLLKRTPKLPRLLTYYAMYCKPFMRIPAKCFDLMFVFFAAITHYFYVCLIQYRFKLNLLSLLVFGIVIWMGSYYIIPYLN